MNCLKLKAKIVEAGFNVAQFADEIEIDRSTMYRKLNDGEKFTVREAQKIKDVLNLTSDEASAIFFE